MSGHNKWSQIKRKKGVADQQRGKEFSHLVREIKHAVREGGEDPATNTALKNALERARSANMPKVNIERALARGAGKGDVGELTPAVYEGYGPGGAALLIETLTDNRNRTVAEIKHLLQKNNSSLADAGSVVWMFKEGSIIAPLELPSNELEALQGIIRALEEHEDVERVTTNVINL